MRRKSWTARDIMTTDVVRVESGTSLREVEKIFLEKGISGAPVADETGGLVGVIITKSRKVMELTSAMDLMKVLANQNGQTLASR